MMRTRRGFFRMIGAPALLPASLQALLPPLVPALAAQDGPALPHAAPGVRVFSRPRDYANDLPLYIERLLRDRYLERRKIIAAIQTREQIIERQKFVRARLWELLGGAFEKTPLNPRIAGSVPRQGYRIDRLIYESRPRLFVTSNLYVPEGRGPFPAVLSSLGHAGTGKTSYYQHLFHTLARKGYMVLAFDPFGQGERIEYPGAAPGESAMGGGTSEHDYAGKRLILLGVNFGLYRAWDGIRGIDYLLSRADVDPKRIGCGGQSGGGTMTMFIAALDERVSAAVVSEGNTENMAQEGVVPPGSVDDAEQNIVPALLDGFDRFDLLHAVAPRPLLITFGNKDAGTTYSPKYVQDSLALFEELKRTYRLFDAEDRVALAETPQRHGYNYELRRASYGWYNRWLGRPSENDSEEPVQLEPDRNLWYTDSGFAVKSLGGETSFTLTRRLASDLRPRVPVTVDVLRTALALPAEITGTGRARVLSITTKHDHSIEEMDLVSEREIQVPAWTVAPLPKPTKLPAIVMVTDAGKDPLVAEGGLAAELARGGFLVCAPDVRGRGQCTPRFPPVAPRYFAGRGEDFYVWNTLVTGRPILGGYVTDLRETIRALRSRPDVDAERIWVIGRGSMGIAALLAMALDPALRGGVIETALAAYRMVVENDRYTTPFRTFLFGLMKQFDLPEVAALVAPRPLLLLNPVGQAGARLDAPAVSALYPRADVRTGVSVTAGVYLEWIRDRGHG